MTPPHFVLGLLGFRGEKPNMADADSAQSVAIGAEVLRILGIKGQGPARGQTAGTMLEDGVKNYLAEQLPARDASRQWQVERRYLITDFRQYEHLARLDTLIRADATRTLSVEIGRDYLVRPDVTVGIVGDGSPVLHAAISCKFTIRSDRVQNIRHEGVILTRHRRGRQPHIVTVTSESLPSRPAAIARGTGEVDAVYHVCLPELTAAVQAVGNAEQRSALEEIAGQQRLCDLRDLVGTLTV